MGPTVMLAAIVSFTGCKSSDKEGKGATEFTETTTGAKETTTYKTTATVMDIDTPNRRVSLLTADGTRRTYTLGPEVRNFDQIHIGDKVKATVTEEVALFLNKAGTPVGAARATTVARAPEGAKPGMAMADTTQVTGKIIAIDGRHVTLQFPDGTTSKVKVNKDIDLTGIRPGDDVTGQVTQAMAIAVEKP